MVYGQRMKVDMLVYQQQEGGFHCVVLLSMFFLANTEHAVAQLVEAL